MISPGRPRACLPAHRAAAGGAYRGSVDGDAGGRRRRGLVLAGIVLVVGVPLLVALWLSDRNVDRQAEALADDLRRAGRQIDDVAALAADETPSVRDGSEQPMLDALGHRDEFTGAAYGTTGISLSYETSWGLARRCVHLLLRDDAPIRTAITDSATCRPLGIE